MPKYDRQELHDKQMELFVAQQIMNASNYLKKQSAYIDVLPMSSPLDDKPTLRGFEYQDNGLKHLVGMGLIKILNPNEILQIGIHVHIIDVKKFGAFYTDLFESVPSVGHVARIVYSMATGKGKINGETFRFKGSSRNRRVFEYLVQNPNKRIPKPKLWGVAGEKAAYIGDNDDVIEFNTIITTLREALKSISPEDLSLKRTVVLKAEVTLL